jgi:hypothetical protein
MLGEQMKWWARSICAVAEGKRPAAGRGGGEVKADKTHPTEAADVRVVLLALCAALDVAGQAVAVALHGQASGAGPGVDGAVLAPAAGGCVLAVAVLRRCWRGEGQDGEREHGAQDGERGGGRHALLFQQEEEEKRAGK